MNRFEKTVLDSPAHLQTSRLPNQKGFVMPIHVPCTHCGKPLTRIPARYKKQVNNFCDTACKAEWQKENQCGEDNPAYTNGGHPVACAQCGKGFTVNAWKLRNRKNHFCSHPCYWEWRLGRFSGPDNNLWRGGVRVKYYGPNWNKQRRLARRRDGFCCQHCGINERKLGRELDVHHLVRFTDFGLANYRVANHLSNLMSLCNVCHRLAELELIPLQPKLF